MATTALDSPSQPSLKYSQGDPSDRHDPSPVPSSSGHKISRKKSAKTTKAARAAAATPAPNPFKDFQQSLDEYLSEIKPLEEQKNVEAENDNDVGVKPNRGQDLGNFVPEMNSVSSKNPIEIQKEAGIRHGKGHSMDFKQSLDEYLTEVKISEEEKTSEVGVTKGIGIRHNKGYSLDFDNSDSPQWPGWEASSPTVIDFVKVSPANSKLPTAPGEAQYRARRRLSRRLSLEVQKDLPPIIRRTHSAPVDNDVFRSPGNSPMTQDVNYNGEQNYSVYPIDDADFIPEVDDVELVPEVEDAQLPPKVDDEPEADEEPPQWTGGGLPPWLAASNKKASALTDSSDAYSLDPTHEDSTAPAPLASAGRNVIDFAKLSLSVDIMESDQTENPSPGPQPSPVVDTPGKWKAKRRLSRRLSLEVTKEPDSEFQADPADLRRSASAPTGPRFQPVPEESDFYDMDPLDDQYEIYPNESEPSDSTPRMSIGRRLSSSTNAVVPPEDEYSDYSDKDYGYDYSSYYPKPEPGANAGGWRGAAQWGGSTGGKTTVIDFTDSSFDPSDYYSGDMSQYGAYGNETAKVEEEYDGNWIKAQPNVKTGRRSMDVWLKASTPDASTWERKEVETSANINQNNAITDYSDENRNAYALNSSMDAEKRNSDGFDNYNLSINNFSSIQNASRFPDLHSQHHSAGCKDSTYNTHSNSASNASSFPDFSSPNQTSAPAYSRPSMVSSFPDYS